MPLIEVRNRTLAWSLAASGALHATLVFGDLLPALWKPWQISQRGSYVLEARLAPEKKKEPAPEPPQETPPPEPQTEPAPEPPREEPEPPPEPVIRRDDPQSPALSLPDPEPAPQPEDTPLARAKETSLEEARDPELPEPAAEPVPAPRAVLQANAPEYPAEALAGRIVGCVLAEIYIDDVGKVERVEIAASTQPGLFDESVRKAYRENFYLPAENEGRRIKSRILGVASFELEGYAPLLCEQHFYDLAREINARPYP